MSNKHVYEAELGAKSDRKTFFESSMLVTRTEFFRDPSLHDDLANELLASLLVQQKRRLSRLCIWSAGCSDGREPYSIAMTVLSWLTANNATAEVRIVASDINEAQIRTAIEGLYMINKKEQEKLAGFKNFYRYVDARNIVMDHRLAERISFQVEDIVTRQSKETFHIIICTNVLLYYDAEYRKSIVRTIASCLKTEGYLYIETIGSRYLKQIGLTRLKPGSHFFQKVL